MTILLKNPKVVTAGKTVEVHSDNEVMDILQKGSQALSEKLTCQHPRAVGWDQSDDTRSWYVGFCMEVTASKSA